MRTKLAVIVTIACVMLVSVPVFAGDLVAALDQDALDQKIEINYVDQEMGEQGVLDENKALLLGDLDDIICLVCCYTGGYNGSSTDPDLKVIVYGEEYSCRDYNCSCNDDFALDQSIGESYASTN